MRIDTKKRKNAMHGFKQMTGTELARESLYRVISQGKRALDNAFLDIGRMMAESIMLMEREELAGPDYHPTNQRLQKWAHEEGSIYVGDQKVKINRPRLRDTETGEVDLKSYTMMREHGQFSEEILDKIMRGVSAQKYEETVLGTASSFGVSSSSVSRKMVELTANKLKEFQTRPLTEFKLFSLFLDTIHRGGEAFLVALGIAINGEKMALGFWQGSSENHALCEELFQDLERRGLVLSKRILFVTDGGSGLIKALRDRFGKKLLHQRCAIHKSRNLQKHLAKKYRKEAHRLLMNALEQEKYDDARSMLKELEKWLRSKNESAADSLLEAFDELLTSHRLKVPALLRKTLMTTNPIESMFSLVRQCEKNIKRPRGSAMLQRWLGSVLLYCEKQFNRVRGYQEIELVIVNIDNELAGQHEKLGLAA
ncbi:MAG: IS256 family transposase [Gammaproteobacteria bacterium]|nr:MAG: IS256 family transposase [Gammaproteobacteria bacterium]